MTQSPPCVVAVAWPLSPKKTLTLGSVLKVLASSENIQKHTTDLTKTNKKRNCICEKNKNHLLVIGSCPLDPHPTCHPPVSPTRSDQSVDMYHVPPMPWRCFPLSMSLKCCGGVSRSRSYQSFVIIAFPPMSNWCPPPSQLLKCHYLFIVFHPLLKWCSPPSKLPKCSFLSYSCPCPSGVPRRRSYQSVAIYCVLVPSTINCKRFAQSARPGPEKA